MSDRRAGGDAFLGRRAASARPIARALLCAAGLAATTGGAGCASPRAWARLAIYPLAGDQAVYEELSAARPAQFAFHEGRLLISIDAAPREGGGAPGPHPSYRGSNEVHAVVSTAKPTQGTLWLGSEGSTSQYEARSLTAVESDLGQEIRLMAANAFRRVELVIEGEPVDDPAGLLDALRGFCARHRVPFPTPGAESPQPDPPQ